MKMTWAWIGGFFEGEGCVTWYEGRPRKDGQVGGGRGAVITIGQKAKEPLTLIKKFLETEGFEGVRLYWRKPSACTSGNAKQVGIWVLQITRKSENQWFLRKVIPHLIQKRQKAKDCLGKTMRQRSGRLTRTDCELIVRLWDQGVNVQAIMDTTGIGRNNVEKVIRDSGRHTGPRSHRFTRSVTEPSGQAVLWL